MFLSPKAILLGLSFIGAMSTVALAHPHNDTPEKDAEPKSWPYFGDRSAVKTETATADSLSQKLEERFELHSKRMEKSLDKMRSKMDEKSDSKDSMDDLRKAAEAMDDLFADGDIFTELADMVSEFANDFETEESPDGTKIFLFDGEELGRFRMEGDKSNRLNIGGLGQNLSIERDTYVKNGKTRTRIVIEMDGGEDVEIDLPSSAKKSDKE